MESYRRLGDSESGVECMEPGLGTRIANFFRVDKDYLPLKLVIIFQFAGIHSLQIFLLSHMKELGMGLSQIGIILAVTPFAGKMGMFLAGVLADRTGQYKAILITSVLTTAVFHSMILTIPSVQTQVTLNASYVETPNMADNTTLPTLKTCGNTGKMADEAEAIFTQCGLGRNNMSDGNKICLTKEHSQLVVCIEKLHYDVIQAAIKASVTSDSQLLYDHRTKCNPYTEFSTLKNYTVIIVTEQVPKDCKIQILKVEEPAILSKWVTFWMFLGFKFVAEAGLAMSKIMLEATIITMTKLHGGKYGLQKMWAYVSSGVAVVASGAILDMVQTATGTKTYFPAYLMFDFFMISAAILASQLNCNVPQTKPITKQDILNLFKSVHLNAMFFILVVMGQMVGIIDMFISWFLLDMGSSKLLIGMMMTVFQFGSVPFIMASDSIFASVGHVNVIIFGVACMVLRLLTYSMITNPWYILPVELLKVFTASMVNAAAATYGASLVPKNCIGTMTSLSKTMRYAIGSPLGAVIAGTFATDYGIKPLLRFGATECFLVVIGYFCLHHFYLKKKLNRLLDNNNDSDRSYLVPKMVTTDYESNLPPTTSIEVSERNYGAMSNMLVNEALVKG